MDQNASCSEENGGIQWTLNLGSKMVIFEIWKILDWSVRRHEIENQLRTCFNKTDQSSRKN